MKILLFCLLTLSLPTIVIGQTPAPMQLTLPPVIYAVCDQEISLYFDNIVLTQTPQTLDFLVDCDIGETDSRRWKVVPTSSDVGTHALTVHVQNADGVPLAHASTQLRVASAESGKGESLRLLIVGDSLTHASRYPNELAKLLQAPGNPKVTMLGTHHPASAAHGVAHEGYGGWTWARFVNHYEPHPDLTKRKFSSPFVFLDSHEQPSLDVARYLTEHCGSEAPDYVVFLLGINDCFGASPDDRQAMDATIERMFEQAEILLSDFRKAAPQAHFGICITPAANSRSEAFQANYQDRYTRWGWKRIQHRLVQRQLEHFADGQERNLSLIPTQINIDPVGGYPENNAVHPNEQGYRQIATSLYAWLKSQLE